MLSISRVIYHLVANPMLFPELFVVSVVSMMHETQSWQQTFMQNIDSLSYLSVDFGSVPF